MIEIRDGRCKILPLSPHHPPFPFFVHRRHVSMTFAKVLFSTEVYCMGQGNVCVFSASHSSSSWVNPTAQKPPTCGWAEDAFYSARAAYCVIVGRDQNPIHPPTFPFGLKKDIKRAITSYTKVGEGEASEWSLPPRFSPVSATQFRLHWFSSSAHKKRKRNRGNPSYSPPNIGGPPCSHARVQITVSQL